MKRLVVILAGVCYAGVASGQTTDVKQLDGLINRYHACFYASARSQFFKQLDAEPHMVAEVAFQACATEEQTLATFLNLHGTPRTIAGALILRHRNALKRKIAG